MRSRRPNETLGGKPGKEAVWENEQTPKVQFHEITKFELHPGPHATVYCPLGGVDTREQTPRPTVLEGEGGVSITEGIGYLGVVRRGGGGEAVVWGAKGERASVIAWSQIGHFVV